MLTSKIYFQNKKISISSIASVFKEDLKYATKMLPKVTYIHVYPNGFQKINVSGAVQVLSHAVASAIKTW
jgi:hypothetical protein